ncbi:hypothetical protein ED92_11000 [Amycolatopsis sp. MJM2582]|nr:hypothetical protein ED92_11000 [Amycolatopsis sp. MJM2582]
MIFGGWRHKEKIVETWKAVVLRVEHDDGRQGVLKANLADGTFITRFRNEILGMRQMSEAGIEGVLRVLDADFQENLMWFVMPEATPLAQHLGTMPSLWTVVTAVEQVTATLLAVKSELGVAHRDIKPDNLFFLDGRAHVGDFGLGDWAPREDDLTKEGTSVGPAHFLAPEMRAVTLAEDAHLADVWALAKTLFVLAHPNKGVYPPPGTHYVQGREFELWSVGGHAGESLGPVLEAATRFDPHDRITLEDFHAELQAWLAGNPEKPRPSIPAGRGFATVASTRLSRRAENALVEEAARRLVNDGARACAELLPGDRHAWIAGKSNPGDVPVLLAPDEYFPRASEDEFAIDTYVDAATQAGQDLRAVVAIGLVNDRGYLVLEVRAPSPTGDRLVWGECDEVNPRMPSAQEALRDLVANMARAVTTADNPH